MTVSILDEIDGVGPKRKKALRRHFGSIKKIKAASISELMEVDGINQALAEEIYSFMQSSEEESF